MPENRCSLPGSRWSTGGGLWPVQAKLDQHIKTIDPVPFSMRNPLTSVVSMRFQVDADIKIGEDNENAIELEHDVRINSKPDLCAVSRIYCCRRI